MAPKDDGKTQRPRQISVVGKIKESLRKNIEYGRPKLCVETNFHILKSLYLGDLLKI